MAQYGTPKTTTEAAQEGRLKMDVAKGKIIRRLVGKNKKRDATGGCGKEKHY